MSNGKTEVLLPESIELSLQEAGDLLQVLDDAEQLAPVGSRIYRSLQVSVRMLTHKLWPELGRLLDDDQE
jgi:hypothetical protein